MEDIVIAPHSRRLAKALDLSKLSSDGCELVFNKIDEDFGDDETFDIEHDYNIDEVAKFAKFDLLDAVDDVSPLNKYKRDMIPVPYGTGRIESNKLMKRIKEQGAGNCPVIGAHVKVHYMYYTELQEIPIDITYLRKSLPEKFQLGSSGLIPAFEYAILSMKKGEKSDFFASYELCFGELGCPPRIPPKADLLFEVQLINFSVDPDFARSSADMESDVLAQTQSEEPPFERVLKRAQELGAIGKAAFNDKNIVGAVRRYREAVRLLDNTQVMNHEDEMQLKEYLCKVYRNLMICHNATKQYKLTCQCATKALQYANQFAAKDMRLFYLWGKALNGLQEWSAATKQLKTALKLAVKNSEKTEIGKEIALAEQKRRAYEDAQKQQYQRMFAGRHEVVRSATIEEIGDTRGVSSGTAGEHEGVRPATIEEIKDTNDDEVDENDAMFEKLMEINMSEFKMKEGLYEQVLGVSSEFNKHEIDLIKSLASKMNLTCVVDKNLVISKSI